MPRILFIRHGHSLSQNEKELVTGRCPEFPLSDKGRKQAEEMSKGLQKNSIHKVYTSPCKRTIETAEFIAKFLNTSYTVEDTLTERSQGDFEMRPKSEVYTSETIRLIHADQFRWAPPGGESLEDVSNRLRTFLQRLEKLDEHKYYLCVTHLMLLWSVFYVATGCNHKILPQLEVENCAQVEIFFDAPETIKLLRCNQSPVQL